MSSLNQASEYPGTLYNYLDDVVAKQPAQKFQTDYPNTSRKVADAIARDMQRQEQNGQRPAASWTDAFNQRPVTDNVIGRNWTDGNWSQNDGNLADSNWSGVLNPNSYDRSAERRVDNWDRRDNQWDRRDRWDSDRSFIDRDGRRCRIVCDNPRPRPQPNLNQIAQAIMGLNLDQAYRIYPHIRVVVRDGQPLAVTQDYKSNRINVETRYGRIVRIDGFY